jgi:hypothetical protein
MKSDTPRYIRFILNEDVIAFNPKADKTKKNCCQTREREKKKKHRTQWRRF